MPKEIKVHEYRVGLTPESAGELAALGHRVVVERGAGDGIGATDADYRTAGATIAPAADDVYAQAELIVKVKEPLARERARLRRGQAVFAYLHLAPDAEQARALATSGAVAIAYETVTSPEGGLPLLAPMSEVAGRMAAQVAAHYLERPHGGRGVLLSGAGGVAPARFLVLGSGVVGSNAARIANCMGAEVTVIGQSADALWRLSSESGARLKTMISDPGTIAEQVAGADAVVGAALIPGALAPKLVTRDMVDRMRRGAVMVDVAIDQGGCFETSRPTTHADPVFLVNGVVHYCVPNMPGAVPRTSTYALNRATLPFVKELAGRGVAEALRLNEHLRNGLNVFDGAITRPEVAQALGIGFTDPLRALATSSLGLQN